MLLFYLKETLKIFRRSTFSSIVTVAITTIAIFLSSVSVFLIFVSQDFSDRVKKNIEVNVYVVDSIQKHNSYTVEEKIKEKSFIQSVKFKTKEEAAIEFLKETGEDFRAVLDQNPLPNSFVVKLKPEKITEKNFENLIAELKTIPGVSDVLYDYSVVVKILKLLRSFEYFIYASAILLILLSIYLVYSNNRLQYESNKNLYKTMKLVGAKLSTMKIPILFYSIIIGLLASIICYFINFIILKLLTAININPKFSIQFSSIHIITFILGIILGILGGHFASMKLTLKIDDKENKIG